MSNYSKPPDPSLPVWYKENSFVALKPRSFSDAMAGVVKKYNLEPSNNIRNSAGRRVRGYVGVEALVHPNINGDYGNSLCTYVPDLPD